MHWLRKKETEKLSSRPSTDIVLSTARDVVRSRSSGSVVEVRSKTISIGKEKILVDPNQLMRMIRQVTQTIGEYKDVEGPYSQYIVRAMRKARSDMVSDLEHHFHIQWEVSSNGKSHFYI